MVFVGCARSWTCATAAITPGRGIPVAIRCATSASAAANTAPPEYCVARVSVYGWAVGVAQAAVVAPDYLSQQFTLERPNQSWATDITYICKHAGKQYLAVVLDLFLRQVIGWSMGSRINTELVLNALLLTLWHSPKSVDI